MGFCEPFKTQSPSPKPKDSRTLDLEAIQYKYYFVQYTYIPIPKISIILELKGSKANNFLSCFTEVFIYIFAVGGRLQAH